MRDPSIAAGKPNGYFEVTSDIDKLLPDKGWRQDVRIGAVRRDPTGAQVGTLFVTEVGENVLTDALTNYTGSSATTASTKRIDQIEHIAPGTVSSLWMDLRPLPQAEQRIWWECWCWPETVANILHPADRLRLRVSEQRLHFPDFEVVPVYATVEDMERLLANTDAIEELRHASDTPHVYTHDLAAYQTDILADLVARVTPPPADAPAACILDTGVARAHPLLAPSLASNDCHAVDEAWQTDDHHGHGTEVAGMALFGDLTYPVGDQRKIDLTHRLESVKLLPPNGFPANEPANLGYITQGAISLPEIEAPDRARVFCMAVTNKDLSGALPTSWSAAMDRATVGLTLTDQASAPPTVPPRLILTSAGNVPDEATLAEAGDVGRFSIEDPAQAWNPLTIGGFTDKVDLLHPNYQDWTAAAEVGDRSPYSRTSTTWIDAPIKPELVFEAGNRALSPMDTELLAGIESLSLLTTNRNHIRDPLTTTWATQPGDGARGAHGRDLDGGRPELLARDDPRPHGAFGGMDAPHAQPVPAAQGQDAGPVAGARVRLRRAQPRPGAQIGAQRSCFDLAGDHAAIHHADEDGQEGHAGQRRPAKVPSVALLPAAVADPGARSAGEKRVELKVTLSYFIEPSPGQIAPKTPARYRSHGLRFDLQRRLENKEQFLSRINSLAAADDAEEGAEAIEIEDEADDRWRFGANSRANKVAGSLHCDVWTGPGADLAARRTLAIYPVNGWWKTRAPKKRYNSQARYALIMTLKCLDEDIDLHAEIDAAIAVRIARGIDVEKRLP